MTQDTNQVNETGMFGFDLHPVWAWESLAEAYKEKPDEAVRAAHQRLIHKVGTYRHGLSWLQAQSAGRVEGPPDAQAFERLLLWMLDTTKNEAQQQSVPRASARLREFKGEMEVFAEILAIGNEQEVWQLPTISDIRVDPHETDPVQPHLVRAQIRAYEKVRSATIDAIVRKPHPQREAAAAGRLLVLLVTDQAALTIEALEAAVRDLATGIYVTGNTWHLDLHQRDSKGQDLELRRLLFDPIAVGYVSANFPVLKRWVKRMVALPIGQRRAQIAKLLTRHVRKLLPNHSRYSARAFLGAAYQWACIHAPAVVARFARRKIESHCVPLASHARAFSHVYPEHLDTADPLDELDDESADEEAERRKAELKRASAGLASVREILDTTDRAYARRQLIELLKTDDYAAGSPRTLFVQFLVDRAERKRGVKPLRVSTMMLMTTLLARRWIAFAPSGLTPTHDEPIGHDMLRQWYQEMVDSCTGNTSVRLVTALRAFTEWLVEADAVEPEPPRDILPGSPPVAIVSAEWLVPSEIDCVRKALRLSPEYFLDRWDREVAICAVDMALAAGLRRSEEGGIRLCDLQVHDGEITLALRAYPKRRLKSLSAVRNVRLISLSDFVRDHLIKIIEREPLNSTRLWSRAMRESTDTKIDYTMAPAINNCMQQALDEPRLHHHHLRHTCANHALIALMSRYMPLTDYVDQFPWLADIIAQRQMYEDMLDRRPTFRGDDLWAIAGWLGHSSPEVTLRHYLHCMDLLQYVGLSRYDEQESRAVLIALGVLPERERRRKQPGGKLALLRAITDRFPDVFCCSEPLNRPQYDVVMQGAQLFRKVEDAWIAGCESLSGHFDDRLSLPEEAEHAVEIYVREAHTLASVPSGRRGIKQHLFCNFRDPLADCYS